VGGDRDGPANARKKVRVEERREGQAASREEAFARLGNEVFAGTNFFKSGLL